MKTVSTKELVKVLNVPKTTLLDRSKREHWVFVRKGSALHWVESRLPADVRFALVARNAPIEEKTVTSVDVRTEDYTNASDKMREKANWRSALLYRYQTSGVSANDFCSAYNSGCIDPVLFSKLGTVSVPTLYRWLKEFRLNGASGIVPKYGVNRGGAGESLTELEKSLLRHFWLQSTQPSIPHALMLMLKNVAYSRCSYQTARRYLSSLPPALVALYREGESRFENGWLPFMEQNVETYASLQCVVSDHHVCDCIVKYRGQLIRPWITTMQDYRSGKVLGWCVCVKPSSLSIIVAYYMAVIRYGIPAGLLFDNGKDYHSKLLNGKTESINVFTPEGIKEEQEIYFNGVFHNIGSSVKFTRVYNGKSKGRQERYFRVIGEYLAKDIGTYIGSDSRSRPEESQLMFRAINGKEKRNDIPDFSTFVQKANAMIEFINDSFICTGKGMNGKTRSQVFEANLPPESEIRHASKEMLAAALVTGEVRKVGRNGVKIGGTYFWHPQLITVETQDVVVKKSLVIDNQVEIFKSTGEFLCTAYGDYFKESDNLTADIRKLEGGRKQSLAILAEQGTNEVQAAPEFETMLDVASSVYNPATLPDVDQALELPKAAGQSAPVYETQKTNQAKLKDPFMETDDKNYL